MRARSRHARGVVSSDQEWAILVPKPIGEKKNRLKSMGWDKKDNTYRQGWITLIPTCERLMPGPELAGADGDEGRSWRSGRGHVVLA